MRTKETVVVGADILDIMSVAMYADPLAAYRELVQNSADAIDDAIAAGYIEPSAGRVDINFNSANRTVVVRDNGIGVSNTDFATRMLSFGASSKRNDVHRGFRGIGRLAALGHCRFLVLRSRSRCDSKVFEIRWDSALARQIALSQGSTSLEELTEAAASISQCEATDEPKHFFEVRLEGVRRLADDRMYNAARIADYLSQVAPVPFHPDFLLGKEIKEFLLRRASLLEIELFVDSGQVYKPYRDAINGKAGRESRLGNIQGIELPAVDGEAAAFGWIVHHDYLGAFPHSSSIRGLRVRSGNMQLGDAGVLRAAFPEERFNSWAIGEFHIFDARLRPNARRDAFEPSVHVDNLFNQLLPHCNDIARRCRTKSKKRNADKKADRMAQVLCILEKTLRGSSGAFVNYVRQMLVAEAEAQRVLLRKMRPNGQMTNAAKSIAKLKRTTPSRKYKLSDRDLGRVEILEELQRQGRYDMIVAVLPNVLSSKRKARKH